MYFIYNFALKLVTVPQTEIEISGDSQYDAPPTGEAKTRSESWKKVNIPGLVTIGFTHMWQCVKSSLSSSTITGSFWAGLAACLVTCPVDRLN